MSNSRLYDHQGFYAWANRQAALLRSGRLAEADIEHIAEEIESIGRSEKRELITRLAGLLAHLLKWQFQPNLRGNSWRLTITEQRQRLVDHLGDNASLKSALQECIRSAYRLARISAGRETGLAEEKSPLECPWSLEQMVAEDFWPEDVT